MSRKATLIKYNNKPERKLRMISYATDNRAALLAYKKEHYRKNSQVYKQNAFNRRAAQLKRTPKWLTIEHHQQIRDMVTNRPPGYHLDHIVPLQGENVSGLHVPWNLQYLPATDNLRKSNKF